MTEEIKRVSIVNTVAGNGGRSVRKKEYHKSDRRDDEHDTVSISEEAKNLNSSKDADDGR